MNHKEAIELLPFIQAFAEGRTVEFKDRRFKDEWDEMSEFPDSSFKYFEFRIKPKLEYRPFKDAKECWNEMQKHQPFGWVKCKDNSIPGKFMYITSVRSNEVAISSALDISYSELIKYYTFIDETPVGVKIEE